MAAAPEIRAPRVAKMPTVVFAKEFASGPSRDDVKLPPEVAKNVPYGADQVGRLIQFDWNAVIPHLDEWTQRFNREIAS